MPIFINGKEYEDEAHMEAAYSPMLKNMGVDVQPIPPAEQKGDEAMVQTPGQVRENQQMDKIEETKLGGIPVSDRIYIGRTPLGASTEPAGEFNPDGATGVAIPPNPSPEPSNGLPEGIDWSRMNQPFGELKGTAPEDTPVMFETKNGIKITEGDFNRALDIAMSFSGGGLTFGGVRARTISPERMTQAHILEGNMVHPDDIWTKTGFMRGADKRWRFEIDDSKAKFDTDWISKAKPLESKPLDPGPYGQIPLDAYEGMKSIPLAKVLDHPELYAAYPWLKGVRVVHNPDMNGAHWNGLSNTIAMGNNYATNKGVLMHEIQHAIQDFEGFAPGSAVKNPENAKAYDLYRRSAGEVESNNVDLRVEMDAKSRRRVPPTHTEDVPRNQQIVTQGYGLATPEGMFDQRTGMAVAQKIDPNLPHK